MYAQELINDIFKNETRISNDAFEILKIMMEFEDLFNISIEGLVIAIKDKELSDNGYSQYIQKFILTFEKGNKSQINEICERMKKLIKAHPNEEIVKKRALEIFNFFHKKTI